jgi:hypothetical protein
MIRVALLMVLMTTGVAAQTPALDVQLVRCPTASAERKCTQNDPMLQTSVKETAERTPMKPTPGVKGLLKDLRPGTCKSTALAPPNTSWPARGEAAISFCRP